MEKRLAIITARGGSKRIPKKNIKDFCGRPIIAYSIEAALKSELFDEVMVSTDSEEIAGIAKKYGANVPFMRSEKTASDFATTADVLIEVLEEYGKRGQEFDYMFCIYPTAPFITDKKLISAYELLKNTEGAKAIMPVVSFSYPPMRGLVKDENWIKMKWPEYARTRSQDLEVMYHDCGQFYAYDVRAYIEKRGLFTTGVMPLVMDELEVQDIDNETDWKLAELKYTLVYGN